MKKILLILLSLLSINLYSASRQVDYATESAAQ
jgi:hypothetical protein